MRAEKLTNESKRKLLLLAGWTTHRWSLLECWWHPAEERSKHRLGVSFRTAWARYLRAQKNSKPILLESRWRYGQSIVIVKDARWKSDVVAVAYEHFLHPSDWFVVDIADLKPIE